MMYVGGRVLDDLSRISRYLANTSIQRNANISVSAH